MKQIKNLLFDKTSAVHRCKDNRELKMNLYFLVNFQKLTQSANNTDLNKYQNK